MAKLGRNQGKRKEVLSRPASHINENDIIKVPENYERFFIPVIGRPLADDLIDLANLQRGERVLDVACGTGIVARLASHKTGKTGAVTGLDINPGMLAVARSITHNSSFDWIEASAKEIPLPNNSFDVALCQLGLQFMDNKPRALQEIQRVLVPGGRLILNVPGPSTEIFAILAEIMHRTVSPEAASFVNRVFSLHNTLELQGLVLDAGFRDVNIQEEHKILTLPAPEKFLWQYVHSTPLIGILAKTTKEARIALEQEVVKRWQNFVKNGSLKYRQRIVTVSAQN